MVYCSYRSLKTIVSIGIFKKIEQSCEFKLKGPAKAHRLEQVFGTPLPEFGRGTVCIQIRAFTKKEKLL